MSQFHKAERKKGKLRLAIAGPAGAGKTYSALLIAFGIGGRVAMIDTERGSGELYDHLGLYDVCTIDDPFEPRKYVEAILVAEEQGYGTIIIDSLSHACSGQGGLLDTQGRIADKTGNSWSAWRQVTPKHNELVDTMLQSKRHVIATMRSKMEYTQVEENGEKQVKKLGMSPIQRDGMEYEFTVFMDLDHSLTAKVKVEGLLAMFEQIILSDAPVERFKDFAKSLEDNVIALNPSSKHMVNRKFGKFEASPSLKHRSAALECGL